METRASGRAGVKRQPNLRESVYHMLRHRIQCGDVGIDEKLFDNKIASYLNISRMPVREALMQLTAEGVLESTPRGFVLRRRTLRQMTEAFEVRRLIEPRAAVMACKRAHGLDLAGLKVFVTQAGQAHANDENHAFLRYRAAFRAMWLAAVPNQALVAAIRRLHDDVDAARLLTMGYADIRTLAFDYMLGLCEAFAIGDATQARVVSMAQLDAATARYTAKP